MSETRLQGEHHSTDNRCPVCGRGPHGMGRLPWGQSPRLGWLGVSLLSCSGCHSPFFTASQSQIQQTDSTSQQSKGSANPCAHAVLSVFVVCAIHHHSGLGARAQSAELASVPLRVSPASGRRSSVLPQPLWQRHWLTPGVGTT